MSNSDVSKFTLLKRRNLVASPLVPLSNGKRHTKQSNDHFPNNIIAWFDEREQMAFLLGRKRKSFWPLHKHGKIVMPKALHSMSLCLSRYVKMSGNPDNRLFDHFQKRSLYWWFMSIDCYATARSFDTCHQNCVHLHCYHNAFPIPFFLNLFAIDKFW